MTINTRQQPAKWPWIRLLACVFLGLLTLPLMIHGFGVWCSRGSSCHLIGGFILVLGLLLAGYALYSLLDLVYNLPEPVEPLSPYRSSIVVSELAPVDPIFGVYYLQRGGVG
jgi:hypothetical protein